MNRLLLMTMVLAILPGCANIPAQELLNSWLSTTGAQTPRPEPAHYHFDWQLSGEKDVGPLQVFDDGRQTWLQFDIGQTVPAIFSRNATGDTLLSYRHQGPYIVLPGVWPMLVIRGGRLESRIERISNVDVFTGAEQDLPTNDPVQTNLISSKIDAIPPRPASSGDKLVHSEPTAAAASAVSIGSGPPPRPAVQPSLSPKRDKFGAPSPMQLSISPSGKILQSVPGLQGTVPSVPIQAVPIQAVPVPDRAVAEFTAASLEPRLQQKTGDVFAISPDDQNLRLALMRWARSAGWRFDAEHWDMDIDIPIVGAARFPGAFIQAVQDLAAATELGDRPVQPCFYSNNVLRIVPYAQACDRTATNGNAGNRTTTEWASS